MDYRHVAPCSMFSFLFFLRERERERGDGGREGSRKGGKKGRRRRQMSSLLLMPDKWLESESTLVSRRKQESAWTHSLSQDGSVVPQRHRMLRNLKGCINLTVETENSHSLSGVILSEKLPPASVSPGRLFSSINLFFICSGLINTFTRFPQHSQQDIS